jgi:hypothetical protein
VTRQTREAAREAAREAVREAARAGRGQAGKATLARPANLPKSRRVITRILVRPVSPVSLVDRSAVNAPPTNAVLGVLADISPARQNSAILDHRRPRSGLGRPGATAVLGRL